MKRTVSLLTITLLLVSMFTATFGIRARARNARTAPNATRMSYVAEYASTSSSSPGFMETSEYLVGSVAVGVVFLQCDGTYDYPFENWTSSQESNVMTEIQTGLTNWETCAHHQNPPVDLTFEIVDTRYRVPVSCEPIRHPHTWEEFWIADAMGYLGYNDNGDYRNMTRAYINNLRSQAHKTWSFAIFVVIDTNASGHTRQQGFTDINPDTGGNWFAWSLFGGSYLVMTYDNAGWGIEEMHRVCAHEVGHIFCATDEYNGRTEYSGYLNVSDIEHSNCLMDNYMDFSISNGTRGQVGWLDSNHNSIYDVVDTYPNTTLVPYSPDPADSAYLRYTGTVVDVPRSNDNPNPYVSNKNVSINTISGVEYRMDGDVWLEAWAVDGAFDGPEEDYAFYIFVPSAGVHTVEVRGNNSVGNLETSYASDVVTVPDNLFPICIRTDGSVDPTTAPIQRNGDVYILTNNITRARSSGIIVEKDNAILDGAGYTIQGDSFWGPGTGVILNGRSNITIANITIIAFTEGIYLSGCSNNTICRNNITSNCCDGVRLEDSSNNLILENNISANAQLGEGLFAGITLWSSTNNSIVRNNIDANDLGGIYLFSSSNNNSIVGNDITNNYWGLDVDSSSDNSISENNITNSTQDGIYLYDSSSNSIYHNNFIDNFQQASGYYTANGWDAGYPSGGNYWSDYVGTDLHSGPYQNETGSDKIGDTPYAMDADNADRYPLIYPYGYVPSPDFNNDRIIDIFDLVRMALAYSSMPSMPNWDPYVDLNQDSTIDIFDIVVVALHFGETS